MPSLDVNVLVARRANGETYWFVYTDGRGREVIEIASRYAKDPELSFDINDFVQLAAKVRQIEVLADEAFDGPDLVDPALHHRGRGDDVVEN